MEKVEVQKEMFRSKVEAVFSHYTAGNLYYTVKLEAGIFQFPIPTVEDGPVSVSDGGVGITTREAPTVVQYTKLLSSDLGTTSFYKEMRGSELNRWIGKAIDKNEFIKIEQ